MADYANYKIFSETVLANFRLESIDFERIIRYFYVTNSISSFFVPNSRRHPAQANKNLIANV